jgi:hypothetical protein
MTIFSFFSICRFKFSIFYLWPFSNAAGLSTPYANEHQDIAGGNKSDDGLPNQLGTQCPSTSELHVCPCCKLSIICVASTTLLVLQIVSVKLHFTVQHKRTMSHTVNQSWLNALSPVRTMCGSRTGAWSLPSVMSDWQRCVDWFLAKYYRCWLRLDWCWCRWRTSVKGHRRWGL